MALPLAIVGTHYISDHYAHAMKTSLWHMLSTVQKDNAPTRDIENFAILLRTSQVMFVIMSRSNFSF